MENEKVANLVISVYFPTFPKIIEIVRSFYHQTFARAFFSNLENLSQNSPQNYK